jgi:hypothetical protein
MAISGKVFPDNKTSATVQDGTTIVATKIQEPGVTQLASLTDVNAATAAVNGMFLQYDSATSKWIGASSTTLTFDPAGYEYTGDSALQLIENDSTLGNGLVIGEAEWTKITCTRGTVNDNLPTSFTKRIWDDTVNRFQFSELPIDAAVIFRLKIRVYPETNNALVSARINFYGVNDGTENILNEDGDRIVLEDGTGNITGDYFILYNFQQTVSNQELADGAGTLHERTYLFPIYVGNSPGQRGFGEFELYSSCETVLYDTAILAILQ